MKQIRQITDVVTTDFNEEDENNNENKASLLNVFDRSVYLLLLTFNKPTDA